MDPVITGISAWQYWTTPPVIGEVDLPEGIAFAPHPNGVGLRPELRCDRGNARELDALVAGRLLIDLKAVDTPVHVMADAALSRTPTALSWPHKQVDWLESSDLVPLGGGLKVLSPHATLLSLARGMNVVSLALFIMEAAGLFAIWNETPAASFVLNALLAQGVVDEAVQRARRNHLREYYDARGTRVAPLGRGGGGIPWELSFDRNGLPTDLWKRAPLTEVDEVRAYALSKSGARGSRKLLEAVDLAINGSGSPLESRALLLMCADCWKGGEGWKVPWVNRRVDYTPAAKRLTNTSYAICDQLWLESGIDVEINGFGYHADRQGFLVKSGRTAALENMGLTVFDITYSQMADLEQWDARVQALSRVLGMGIRARTSAFLERRECFHEQLFERGRKKRR